MAAYQVPKLNFRHRELIAWMLANPDKPLKDAAEHMGYHPSYLYTIRNSDMFRAAYEEQRAAVDGLLHFEMVDKLVGAVDMWLERVTTKLANPNGIVSERFLGDVGKTLLTARYGGGASQRDGDARASSPITVNIQANVLSVARERAAEAHRGRSAALPRAGENVVDAEVLSIV